MDTLRNINFNNELLKVHNNELKLVEANSKREIKALQSEYTS